MLGSNFIFHCCRTAIPQINDGILINSVERCSDIFVKLCCGEISLDYFRSVGWLRGILGVSGFGGCYEVAACSTCFTTAPRQSARFLLGEPAKHPIRLPIAVWMLTESIPYSNPKPVTVHEFTVGPTRPCIPQTTGDMPELQNTKAYKILKL